MRSPFPGMDPYLEAEWPDVQSSLLPLIREALQKQLPPNLRAVIQRGVELEDTDGEIERRMIPDVYVSEFVGSVRQRDNTPGGVALAEPFSLVLTDETLVPRWIQIVDVTRGNRVVTVIKVLSHSNKAPGDDNLRYLRNIQDYTLANVSVVEIGLLRVVGRTRMSFDTAQLPKRHRHPYLVSVKKGWTSSEWLIYAQPIRERLKPFHVPLRNSDTPAVLDLQPLMDDVYEQGQFYRYIDYAQPLDPPLSTDDAAWAQSLIAARPA